MTDDDPTSAWDYPEKEHRVKASDHNPRVPITMEGPDRGDGRFFWTVLACLTIVLILGVLIFTLKG